MDTLADLLGASPAIVTVREQARRLVARLTGTRRPPPLLIHGATGTGKGLLAGSFHRAGPRRHGPFVAINCAAIPEPLLEAELFGFEQGAFTDAHRAKAGLIEVADRGTLFLDEVGLLPAGVQGKLLTVLEERTVRRLGSTRSVAVDVWIAAATSMNLESAVRAGGFREDLYHRLAVVILHLPPLRERGDDIVVLAEHFLARACADYGVPAKRLTPEAGQALLAHSWPGNVRELANVMERVALLVDETDIGAAALGLWTPLAPAGDPGAASMPSEAPDLGEETSLPMSVRHFERERIVKALGQAHGNVSRAARALRMPRNTLRHRIVRLGLDGGTDTLRVQAGGVAPSQTEAGAGDPPEPSGERQAIPPGIAVTLLRVMLDTPPVGLGATSAGQTLQPLLERVQYFGGTTLTQSRGAFVAAFGLEPTEDAPTRAASAALSIRKASEGNRDARAAWARSLALHTVRRTSHMDAGSDPGGAAILRDAEPVLAALNELAGAGEIVVSPTTAQLLWRRFALEPLAAAAGLPGPAHRLVGLEWTGYSLGGRPLSAFVGRWRELVLLHDVLSRAARGQGQAVGVMGEPGVGKSRLMFELRETLAHDGIEHREGRCVPHGAGVPYLPLVDLLRHHFRATDADLPDTMVARVDADLRAVGAAPGTATYLLRLLGVETDGSRTGDLGPEALKIRTFEALHELLLRHGRRRPLVVLLEDLHWIDQTSEAFLESLVPMLAASSILLLASYRPGYQPRWLAHSHATQLTLPGLDPLASLHIVRRILGAGESTLPTVARALVARADGNPFFLEEMAWSVREAGGTGEIGIPATIQATIGARIGRLAEPTARCLGTAAVLGRTFSRQLLEAVAQADGFVSEHLRELERREFLHESSVQGEPGYTFKHALTQEVAYERCPAAERAALHVAVAQALERLHAGRLWGIYDLLAHHYGKAADDDKAVQYLLLSAERATAGYALVEAVTTLETALPLAERLDADRERRVLKVVLALGVPMVLLGRLAEARDLFLRYRARVDAVGDPALAGLFFATLAVIQDHTGDGEGATTSADRALLETERTDAPSAAGRAHMVLSFVGFWGGEHQRGARHAEDAVAKLSAPGEGLWRGMALYVQGLNLVVLGELDRAQATAADLFDLGDAIADRRLQSYGRSVAGWAALLAGDVERAAALQREAVSLAPDPLALAVVLQFSAEANAAAGHIQEARAQIEQSRALLRRFHFPQLECWALGRLSEIELADGRLDQARTMAGQALELGHKFRYGRGLAERVLGRVALAARALPQAAAELATALDTFSAIEARPEMARTQTDLGTLALTKTPGGSTGTDQCVGSARPRHGAPVEAPWRPS